MGRYRSRSRSLSRSYSPRPRYSRSPPPPRRRGYYDDPRDRYRPGPGGGGGGGGRGYRGGDYRSAAPSGLLVRNIALDARPEDLRIPFERYGAVKYVYLPKNYYTGEPRGFGFVKFRNPDDAAEAKVHMNHKVIDFDKYECRERERGTRDDYYSPKRSISPSAREEREYRSSRRSPSPEANGRSPSRSRSYSP